MGPDEEELLGWPLSRSPAWSGGGPSRRAAHPGARRHVAGRSILRRDHGGAREPAARALAP
eukprot:8812445-Alexandrium_andersonii.AAC.1